MRVHRCTTMNIGRGEHRSQQSREPHLASDAPRRLARVVYKQSGPEYVGRHHSGFDGMRFVVAVRRWELTPGQVVFGVWMREMQTTELGNGPLSSQLEATGRFYPVHPSRYTISAVEYNSLHGGVWSVGLLWRILLDMQRLEIAAGWWNRDSQEWWIHAHLGEPWVMYNSATAPATEWEPNWLTMGPSQAMDARHRVRPSILFVPGAKCVQYSDGRHCPRGKFAAIACEHGEGAHGQHAPVEIMLFAPLVNGTFKEGFVRLRGAYPRVPRLGTWPRWPGTQGFMLPADPQDVGEDPGEAPEA